MRYEPITILSAELSALDFYANVDRTNELRLALLNKGLNIVGITLHEGATKRQAFMVVTPKYSDLLDLARKFGQSSIFISDEERTTCEIKTKENGQIVPIGKLCSASKDSTVDSQLKVSFIEDGKEFIFVTEQ